MKNWNSTQLRIINRLLNHTTAQINLMNIVLAKESRPQKKGIHTRCVDIVLLTKLMYSVRNQNSGYWGNCWKHDKTFLR